MDTLLKDIVEHAYYNTQFYYLLYKNNNIDISSFAFEELPFTTQNDLICHHNEFRAKGQEVFRVSSSSGTTRHPKTVYRTKDDFEYSVSLMLDILKSSNLSQNDIVYIGQPFDLATFGYLVLDACKHLGILSIPGGLSQSNERMLELISYYNVNIIMTAPSRMKYLTEMVKINYSDAKIQKIIAQIDKIMLAGEPLSNKDRMNLEDFWGCKVYNYYGSEETDSLGMSNDGEYIELLKKGFYYEFIEVNDNVYEIVITSLYHRGTPLIRYKLGDLVTYLGDENGIHKVKVIGKNMDVLNLYDGVKLYAYQVEQCIKDIVSDYTNFQIICEKRDYKDIVTVLIHTNFESLDYTNLEDILKEKIWGASIDLGACKNISSVEFNFYINKKELTITRRGKTPRIIDLRSGEMDV